MTAELAVAQRAQHRAGPAAAIELIGVDKTFGDFLVALDAVSLAVRPREFVCIIGPSGCGKSTILNMIAGIVKPSGGTVAVGGGTPQQAREAHQIGLVFQDAVLLPWRTVRENVELPLEVLRIGRAERRAMAEQVLDLVGLHGFEDRFPHQLSGGMRQRVGIARALSFDPQILLMDEPFGALDAITRDRMTIELLKIWERRQKTVVFVTHSIDEAAFLADRVIVMTARPGRIHSVIENTLPRPRPLTLRDDPGFIALSRSLRMLLEAS